MDLASAIYPSPLVRYGGRENYSPCSYVWNEK